MSEQILLAALSGNTGDDGDALSAGTGQKIAVGINAIGGAIAGASDSVLLATDSSGHLADGPAISSVAIVSAPNTFTATQTFRSTVATTDTSGNPLVKIIPTSVGTGTNAGQVMLYGANSLDASQAAWYFAIDISGGGSTVRYRNMAIGYMDSSGGPEVARDQLYANLWGAGDDSTWNYGQSGGGDTGAFRHNFAGPTLNTTPSTIPGLGVGTVRIAREVGQTGHVLSLIDRGSSNIEKFVVDPSNAGTWQTILRGDAGTSNPIFVIQTTAAGNAEQLRITANGQIQFNADSNAILFLFAAGTIGTSNTLNVGGSLTLKGDANAGIFRVSAGITSANNSFNVPSVFLHKGTTLGLYNHAAATQPSLTYSRSGAGETAAGAAMRTALASVGLIADNTTA